MKENNLLNQINFLSKKDIKSFGIKEILIIDGELYTTSCYDLPDYIIKGIEDELNINSSNE